jgi:hypothetical protein
VNEESIVRSFRIAAGALALPLALLIGSISPGVAAAADNSKLVGTLSFYDNSCTSPVHVDGTYSQTIHIYYDQAGNPIRIALTGTSTITWTNLDTGATYSPNVSGPVATDLLSGQTYLRGGNVWFSPAGILTVYDGRVVLDADANEIFVAGHQAGVCAALGSTPIV